VWDKKLHLWKAESMLESIVHCDSMNEFIEYLGSKKSTYEIGRCLLKFDLNMCSKEIRFVKLKSKVWFNKDFINQNSDFFVFIKAVLV